MGKYLNNNNVFLCIAFLLALHTISFPFVQYPVVVSEGPSWYGLDVSWQMTLDYALIKKWVWGNDIIYTYGPLGFLGTRIGWGISRWWFLLTDLFIAANFFCIFRDFINAARDKWVAVLVIFICTIAAEPSHRANIAWIITLFAFYWMYRSYKEPKFLYFILLCVDVALCFYIKLNAGFIGITLLIVHLVNLLIFKKIKLPVAVMVMIMQAAMVGLLALIFHVSLPGYIKGALEIVKGYNDSMFLEGDSNKTLFLYSSILFYCTLGFIAVYTMALTKTKNYSQLFFAGIAAIYVVLLRKQGIIRNDYGHYFEFFSYLPFVLLTGNFLKPFEKQQRLIMLCMLGITGLSFFYTTHRPMRGIGDSIKGRYTGHADYLAMFNAYNSRPYLDHKKDRYIPDSLLARIGQSTIDVFPWDCEYLLENKLNYTPRPVFQSFSAYTEYLQKVNYSTYLSKAPEYLLYDYETIDFRYPFNDDILVNFFICKNYTFADSFYSNGYAHNLLRKKEKTTPISLVKTNGVPGQLKQEIPVNKAMMLKIAVDYTLQGKLESIFYRSAVMRVKMMRVDGIWVTYRVSKELLSAGIMVDRYIANNNDFVKYIGNRDMLDNFSKIIIEADTESYKKDIKVEYINVQ